MEEWIGRVLTAVAADAEQRGEPRLTSLSRDVRATRSPTTIRACPDGTDARTRERVAAEDRLECYRSFGATMPADGGTPTVLAPLPVAPRGPRAAVRRAAARLLRPLLLPR